MGILDKLHKSIMRMNIKPTGDREIDQLLAFYFNYQEIGDDLDRLAALGGLVHAETQKEGYSVEEATRFKALFGLILWRVGSFRMTRVIQAITPQKPPSA
jgi:hypothetical protein